MNRALLCLLLFVMNGAAAGAPSAYGGDDAAQDVWLLENGAPEAWTPALRRLLSERHLRKHAVASVLRRMDVLRGEDRVRLCQALGTASHDPRALQALIELARDPADPVRRAARAALANQPRGMSVETLLALAAEEGEGRIRFIRAWAARYREGIGARATPRQAALIAHASGRRDERAFAALSRLLLDADTKVAEAATDALGLLLDTRVEDLLLEHAAAGSTAALFQLARRGDPRAFGLLMEWGRREADRARDDFDRRKTLERAGGSLPALYFPRLVAQYRAAADALQKARTRSMLEGHLGLGLLDEPAAMDELRALAGDADEFLRSVARKVLAWESNRDAVRLATRKLHRTWLTAASLAGALLGVLLYLLAFRLLALKRFVRGLPVQKIRSVPVGLVALQGEVRLFEEQHAAHPFTGEKCVVFEQVRMPFWLDDATGRVLVDPRGAALLSEDGMLVPGEKVLVVGILRQDARVGDTPAQRRIARRDRELTWFTRATGWLLRAATGLFLGRNAARMMFLNERQCFWIWDELDERPFLQEREAHGMTAGLLFAGSWTLVFLGAALGLSG